MVKTEDARWVTFSRYVAEIFATKSGVVLPTSGIRIEMTDPLDIKASTLTVKTRGAARISLTRWVKTQKDSDQIHPKSTGDQTAVDVSSVTQ